MNKNMKIFYTIWFSLLAVAVFFMTVELIARANIYNDQEKARNTNECIKNGINSKECFGAFYGKYNFDFK